MRTRFVKTERMAETVRKNGFEVRPATRTIDRGWHGFREGEKGFAFDTTLTNRELERLGIISGNIITDGW